MSIRIIGNENTFLKYIKGNLITCIIALSIFSLGILLGTMYFRNNADGENISSYVENSIIKMTTEDGADNFDLFRKSIVKNIIIGLAFWILGASIIGVPALIMYIGYRGFRIGFTISTFISAFGIIKGNVMSLIMMFSHNILLLGAMIISLVSSVKLSFNILVKKKDMKYELLKHTVICAFCMILFILSSAVEVVLNGPVFTFFLNNVK